MFIKKYDATINDDIFPITVPDADRDYIERYISNPATANNKRLFISNSVAVSLYDVKAARRLIKKGSAADFAALFSLSERQGFGGLFSDNQGGWYRCDMEKAIGFVGMYYPRYFRAVSDIFGG